MATASELVSTARRASGMTQRGLAALSGVDQASIARIERGTTIPRTDTLERLLHACGRTLTTGPADDSVDRSLIRARLAMTPAERHRLGIQSARALLRLRRSAAHRHSS